MHTPSSLFVPPHCPRTRCRFHHSAEGWRWIRWGSYSRQCPPHRIARFRCVDCGVTFSRQSFSADYRLKRPELLEPLFHRLVACSGMRQIAREARVHPSTVTRQAARLGRHALLFLAAHRPHAPLTEPLVIDGFESFAYSQYDPLHLNLAVGAHSHFVYAFTHAPLRRKGRMREAQKRRRAALERRLGRPEPQALERSVLELVRLAVPRPQPLTVRSDEHPAYPRALRRLKAWSIRHECTPSVQARTSGNPLFPVNLMDLLLRHNSANHKRETIAFSKRHQAVIERAAVLIAWRNYSKPFSENHGGGTPAMRAGVHAGPLSVRRMLARRLFRSRIEVPEPWAGYLRGRVPTRDFTPSSRHRPAA